jgi:hypothetical protein
MVSRPTRHPLLQLGSDPVLPLPLWKGRADEEPLLRHSRHLDDSACDKTVSNRIHNDLLHDPSRFPTNDVFILLYPRTIRNRKRSERSTEDPCDSQSKLFVCI